jgi:arsenite methyltransferase
LRKSVINILVDPITKLPLRFGETSSSTSDNNLIEGSLIGSGGRSYPISNGIPRFVLTEDLGQKQTERSFGFKWRQLNTYNSPQARKFSQSFVAQRYGFDEIDKLRAFFRSRQRILDAGCGSGYGASLWMNSSWRDGGPAEWFGVDISAAIDVAQERLEAMGGTHFIQADILQLPFREGAFDTISSEGVLHHTPSTEKALKSLAPLLETNGHMLFYVYRKKGPIREFTDDHIRDLISPLPPAEAWALLRPLTKLGKALADLHAEIDVAEDIPYLGIKAGRYDVQRFIYWHLAKLFWNETFSFEENNHVNFDWYHPRYSHRHTEDEIRQWCAESALSIKHFDAAESGYTVWAVKE